MSVIKTSKRRLNHFFQALAKKLLIVVIALAVIMVVLAMTGYNVMSVLHGIGRALTEDIGGTLR